MCRMNLTVGQIHCEDYPLSNFNKAGKIVFYCLVGKAKIGCDMDEAEKIEERHFPLL